MVQVLPPPYNTDAMFTTREIPYGFKYEGDNSPYNTIQVLGGGTGKDTTVRMGWAVINIDAEGKLVNVDFDKADLAYEQKTGKKKLVSFEDRVIPYNRPQIAQGRTIVPEDRMLVPESKKIIQEKKPDIQPIQERGLQARNQPTYTYREYETPVGRGGYSTPLSSENDSDRRRRKRYREKPWWEDEMYEENVEWGNYPRNRYYRNHKVLPPNLEGEL